MEKNRFCICLISDTLCDANGVSRFIQDMCGVAREEGKEFYAISASTKPYCKKERNIIVLNPAIKTKMPWYPELDLVMPPFQKLKRVVSELKPNLIHISTPGPIGLYGLRVAKALEIPTSATYHTDFPSYIMDNTKSKLAKSVANRFMKHFYRSFDAVFVRSMVYTDILKNEIGVDDGRIFEIKPGIDTAKFNPTYKDKSIWQKYPNISPTSIKALYVGRLTAEKNFGFLIECWKHFFLHHKDALEIELVCVGEGKYISQKEQLSHYNVRFLGHKGGIELSTIYASSDFFLFPSVTDTLGQVVMEAQNSGLPVIVSDIGGPKGVINLQGESGFALSIDKELWAEKIALLANNQELRAKMGMAGTNGVSKMGIKESFCDFWRKNSITAGFEV